MSISAVTYAQGKDIAALTAAIAASIALGNTPVGQTFMDQNGFLTKEMQASTDGDPDIQIPLTGDTITLAPGGSDYTLVVNPAGTIAALTVNCANGTRGGQKLRMAFADIVTALTLGANFAAGALPARTAGAVNQSDLYEWSVALTKWERVA